MESLRFFDHECSACKSVDTYRTYHSVKVMECKHCKGEAVRSTVPNRIAGKVVGGFDKTMRGILLTTWAVKWRKL